MGGIQFVDKCEYTTTRKLRKTTLKILIFLFIFCLGFIISELRYTGFRQMEDDFNLYVYDTEQKLEDFYKSWQRQYLDKTGLSPEAREWIAELREQGRPLVAVGPFAIFVDNDGNRFSIRELQPLWLPLVELEFHEQSKYLHLISSLEKSWVLPRFRAFFHYSEDGVYEKGTVSVHRKNGMPERVYFDTKRIGVFDVMHVYDYDSRVTNIYTLNGLSWEKYATREWTEVGHENPFPTIEEQFERGTINKSEEH